MPKETFFDPRKPFASKRPETHEEWQARMGGEVLAVVRSGLYLDFRFLDMALSALTPVPDERCGVLATDGVNLYYQPSALLRLYQKNPKYLNRLYLHTVFHCIFRHLWLRGKRDKRLWDLACDIAVENVIDGLGRKSVQRPILLMGPPGIGKTQVMEQAARECGVALVAYTITHHTRQSAVGLPFIRQRNYGGRDVSVTEYTMSEIIASIYAKMEATGLKEGILFIDEINCVSETLAPTMLQFLQCKTFGNQAVPAGWVIVAAGNPPEYNKSVRDFDIVTLDRVRRMDIEPDLPVWKDYARAAHIHSAILSYLELHPQNFYQINADVDGTQFVTARGWEDLSNLLDTYETLGLQADEDLIKEYLQHPKIAEDFSAYLDLYYKYRDDYGVEEILVGQAKPAVFARLLQAPFDERLSLVSLLLAGLNTRFAASRRADAVADACYAFLRETKKALATLPEDIPDGSAELFRQQIEDYEAETQRQRTAGLLSRDALQDRLQVQAVLRQWEGELRRATAASTQPAFDLLREQFRSLANQREVAQKMAGDALEAAFDFMEQAFAESQEMVVFVTELTVNPVSHAFLTENGCERYFKYNKDLLLDHRKAALQQELAAEARRHGGV